MNCVRHITINADSTIALFKQLEATHLTAVCLHVVCDNARYYRSKAVQEYLETSRIKLVFLPPYAPNVCNDSSRCPARHKPIVSSFTSRIQDYDNDNDTNKSTDCLGN